MFLLSLTPLNIIPLCYFQRAYWDNHEGSHISRGRHPKDCWTCPMEKGKIFMFLTNMAGPSWAASLAQHGVCTCSSYYSSVHLFQCSEPTAQTHLKDCSSPPCKPHTLHGCAVLPEKIAFWHLSPQTSTATSNSWKLHSLFKTEVVISTESN